MRLAVLCALAATAAQADPAAWHVKGDGPGDLWLLGSVHYLRDADYPLPDVIDELYVQADALVMEIDLDDLDEATTQAQFLRAAMLPANQTLRDVLGADDYDAASSHALSLGIDLALLDRLEPWLVAVTMLDAGMGRLGFRADLGVEQYLLERAGADSKEIVGLETLETQIRVFDDLSAVEQKALVQQTLAELDTAQSTMTDMVTAWREGSLDELSGSLLEEFEEFPDLYAELVVSRNIRWLARLDELLEKPATHLVVVGALHLVGEDSVVDLLSSRGYSVERLP
jgi:uncharacterized protein